MIGLLLLTPLAMAMPSTSGSNDLGPVQAWSTTAVEARPALSGKTLGRFAERLGLNASLGHGWRVGLIGGFRGPSLPDSPVELDVWRGVVEQTTDNRRFTLGRMVHTDSRGGQRLDGLALDLNDGSAVRWSLWGGRRWHPEVEPTLDFLVAGGQLMFGSSRSAQLAVGVEGRDELSEFTPRAWVAGDLRDVVGNRVSVLGELSGERRWRGSLDGTLVVGRYLDIGAQTRWEGLPPSTALDEPRSPMLWLAPDGYGIATASARWSQRRWSWTASGGSVLRRDAEAWVSGGKGGVAIAWQPNSKASVQAFGSAAGIDRGYVAGGGVGVGLEGSGHLLDGTAALWSLRPIDGDRTQIAEGRLSALGKIVDRVRGNVRGQVFLGARGSAGRDRQLRPFAYGGGQLTVRFLGGAS